MSEPVIRAADADVIVKPGLHQRRTKLKIVERNTDPTKHIAIAYLDDDERAAVVAALLPTNDDRLALAQAIAGDGYRVVAVGEAGQALADAARAYLSRLTASSTEAYCDADEGALRKALDRYDAAGAHGGDGEGGER